MVDRACGFNRRYCGDACAAVGRAESVGKAQKAYRAKPAVRARHRLQERARRARVRDHIQQPAPGRVTVERMVAPTTLVAAPAAPPAPAPTLVAAAVPPAVPTTPLLASPAGAHLTAWRLIVGHALAATAKAWRRRGTVMRCACCGRAGRVVAVVVRTELEWRRQRDEDGS